MEMSSANKQKKKSFLDALSMPEKGSIELEMEPSEGEDSEEAAPEGGEESQSEAPADEKSLGESDLSEISDDELMAELKRRGLSAELDSEKY